MSYDKKLRIRLGYYLFLTLCGVASIIVSLLYASKISDFSRGFFSGLGFSLVAAGAVLIVKNISILRNPEKFRAERIKEEDERNTALNLTSSHITFVVCMLLLFAASIYYAFNNESVLNVLACLIMVLGAVKLISYMILQKRM